MSKMIQIRNVPDELYRTLEARAAMAGMSLSDDLLAAVQAPPERLSRAELLERMRRRGAVELSTSAADTVAANRLAR